MASRYDYGDQASATGHALQAMAGLIIRDANDSDVKALAWQISILGMCNGTKQESIAVYKWIRDNIKYCEDPLGTEWVQGAPYTLRYRCGDCDCMVVLAGALLRAMSHDVAPLGVCWKGIPGKRQADETPSHAVLLDGTAQLIIDPVSPVPPEQWPPKPYEVLEFWSA